MKIIIRTLLICCFVILQYPIMARAADTVAPVITDVKVVNPVVQKPGILYIDVTFVEDGVGLDQISCSLYRPNGNLGPNGLVDAFLCTHNGDLKNPYSGTIRLSIPIHSTEPEGKWRVASVAAADKAGNMMEIQVVPPGTGEEIYIDSYSNQPEPSDWKALFPYIDVKNEFDIGLECGLGHPKLIEYIKNMEDGKTANILIDKNQEAILPKEAFDAIKGTKKQLVLYKGGYQWIFKGEDIIHPTKDINLDIVLKTEVGKEYGVSGKLVSVQFKPNGELPGKATIRLKSDYLYNMNDISGDLYLYYLDGGKVKDQKAKFTLVFDGTDRWCHFDITHNSTYLISNKKISSVCAVTSIGTPLKKLYIQKGKTFTPSVVLYNGSTNVTSKLTWKSSDKKVATVSAKGVIRGIKKGKAKITATTPNKKKLTITVCVSNKSIALKSVTVKAPKTLKVGKTYKMSVKLSPVKATGQKVTFKSSNKKALSVDKAGMLYAKKKGTYKITVTAGKKKITKKVKVVK